MAMMGRRRSAPLANLLGMPVAPAGGYMGAADVFRARPQGFYVEAGRRLAAQDPLARGIRALQAEGGAANLVSKRVKATGRGLMGAGRAGVNAVKADPVGVALSVLDPRNLVRPVVAAEQRYQGAKQGGDYGQALNAGLAVAGEMAMAAGAPGRGMMARRVQAYHGTNSEFDQFGRIDGGNAAGQGYYFTTDPEAASRYALGDVNRITPEGNAHPNVRPVELEFTNPWDGTQPADRDLIRRLAKAHNEIEPGYWKRGELARNFDRPVKARDVLQTMTYNPDEQNAILRAAGYDARVKAYDENDIMVFDPSQIKPRFGR